MTKTLEAKLEQERKRLLTSITAYYATAPRGDLHEVFPMYRTRPHRQGGWHTEEGAPIATFPT